MNPSKPLVGVYYFPNYHRDSRNEKHHGKGWTEWELVKNARARFPGHGLPVVPAWGYTDEADPMAMAQKIDAAADHGIDFFLFDWYHYNDGPFLERGLDEGFLGAQNNHRLKFALMWANHDWLDIHPARNHGPYDLLYPGAVTPESFVRITDGIIEKYFRHPSHLLIDGQPFFSIYCLSQLIDGFGSIEATRAALEDWRRRTIAAGFPGLHLNGIAWKEGILPFEEMAKSPYPQCEALGFDSVGSYIWIHYYLMNGAEPQDYLKVFSEYLKAWQEDQHVTKLPLYPNVTMGWDPSPRTAQDKPWKVADYPFDQVMVNNTPENFGKTFKIIWETLKKKPGTQMVTINAWNEWTEGSYLEPDTVHGMGYLEAIRDAKR